VLSCFRTIRDWFRSFGFCIGGLHRAIASRKRKRRNDRADGSGNHAPRLKQVLTRTGLSRSIYAYHPGWPIPAPISISVRCVAWIEEEIDWWMSDRIAVARRRN